MADYSGERSVGARVASARRSRGFRTTRDLAAAMEGTGVTAAILENIESGRKSGLDVSQLLNVAKVLGVPVTALLAPVSRPGDALDLPNLGPSFDGMTAAEFDAWLGSVPNAAYVARSASERQDLAEIHALRELQVLNREQRRQSVADALENESGRSSDRAARSRQRIADLADQISALRDYLLSAGWDV